MARFFGYTLSFKVEGEVAYPTISDVQTLKGFIHNKGEPSHYKSQAAFILECLYLRKEEERYEELGAEYFRQAISFAQGATTYELDVQIPRVAFEDYEYGNSDNGHWTVREFLDQRLTPLRELLSELEYVTPKDEVLATTSPLLEEFYRVRWHPLVGKSCDCCKRMREELELVNLHCCSRCKMAYYCSKECQKKSWQAGHKEACRKEGEIKPGVIMKNRQSPTHPVVVIRAASGSRGVWEIKPVGGDLRPLDVEGHLLSTSELTHARPAI